MRTVLVCGAAALLLVSASGLGRAQDQPDGERTTVTKNPVPDLIKLLEDKDTNVRRAAAAALKYYPRADEAVPALVKAFTDADEVVRDNAVDAVVLVAPKYAVGPLTEALRNRNPLARRHAARALGRLQRYVDEAVPSLILLLKDENDDVRQTAAEAIKRIHQTSREY